MPNIDDQTHEKDKCIYSDGIYCNSKTKDCTLCDIYLIVKEKKESEKEK